MRFATLTFLLLWMAAGCMAESEYVFPQFVDGGGWRTTFIFHNDDAVNVQCTAWTIFHMSSGYTGPILPDILSQPLQPNQTLVIQTPGTSSPLLQGYIIAQDNGSPKGCPVAFPMVLLTYRGASGQISEAFEDPTIIYSTSLPTVNRSVWFDHRSGFATGIAVANYYYQPCNVSITFYDGDTGRIINTAQGLITVPGFTHQSFSVGDLFPETVGHMGFMRIISNHSAVLVLRFNPGGAFTQE